MMMAPIPALLQSEFHAVIQAYVASGYRLVSMDCKTTQESEDDVHPHLRAILLNDALRSRAVIGTRYVELIPGTAGEGIFDRPMYLLAASIRDETGDNTNAVLDSAEVPLG